MYLRQSWGYKKHAFKKARETEGRQSDVESETREGGMPSRAGEKPAKTEGRCLANYSDDNQILMTPARHPKHSYTRSSELMSRLTAQPMDYDHLNQRFRTFYAGRSGFKIP